MQLRKLALRGMIILAIAIALCLLFSGTIRTLTTPKVRYAPVKMGKFEKSTQLTGKVVFPKEENLSLTVPEGYTLTVTRVLAVPGQKVKAGDKLLTAVVTDAEKTLATLQKEKETAQDALDAWDRKNSGLRLSRGEQQWMEAYYAAREAERAELEARLNVLSLLSAMPPAASETETAAEADTPSVLMPNNLPEGADEVTQLAFSAWQDAEKQMVSARAALKGLERFAIDDATWTLLREKRESEEKRDEAEHQIIGLRLLSSQVAAITAPHAGYVASVSVEKNGTISGENVLLTLTPEDQQPVIRADISDIKTSVQKGTSVSVDSDSWGRVETKVVNTGLSETGHPYADAEITEDVVYALGQISAILKDEIRLRVTTRAQESTCLVPASAVRGGGDGRYVYVGEQSSSAFAGPSITVRKMDVNVLGESASQVSVAEDLTYLKVLYMEDRTLSEGGTVMLYEE